MRGERQSANPEPVSDLSRSIMTVPLATCCERPIPKMLWTEHIRTNRDILGEADARHCQPSGAWRIVVRALSAPTRRTRTTGRDLSQRSCGEAS